MFTILKIDYLRYLGEKCWTRNFMWFGWVWQRAEYEGISDRWSYFSADKWMIWYIGHEDWSND